MKLPLIKSCEKQADKVVLNLLVESEHEAFDGHFPNYPILPGVVQLNWVMEFSVLYFGLNIEELFAQDIQIKFQKIIQPDCRLVLTLQFDAEKKRLTFSYAENNLVMSSGKIKIGRIK